MAEAQKSNRAVVVMTLGILAAMVALVSFSVPLYRIFCQVTGYGGTTQVAEQSSGEVLAREMTVRFNADIDRDLPWEFRPVERSVKINVGERTQINYYARNDSRVPVTGHAVFNVTPQKAGIYFSKIECFCFTEQTLQPGEEVLMPVDFFVDPDIADDKNLDDVRTITLSYTFYLSDDQPGNVSTISSAATDVSVADVRTQQ